MGLNAQTTVPTFTSGEVLTAQNQNLSARTGVPVFATTVERDAAFGGAGEKTLAEGQLCYLESTNVVQYYDGAAWATVGPSSAGGLVFISATTIGSAVSSVTVTSAFSSTYDNYFITCNGGTGGTDYISFRFGTTSTSTYQFARMSAAFGDASLTFTSSAAATSIERVGYQSANGSNAAVVAYGPNLAARTGVTFASTALLSSGQFFHGSGLLNDTTQYTSFTLIFGAAQTGGTIRVYGYANS